MKSWSSPKRCSQTIIKACPKGILKSTIKKAHTPCKLNLFVLLPICFYESLYFFISAKIVSNCIISLFLNTIMFYCPPCHCFSISLKRRRKPLCYATNRLIVKQLSNKAKHTPLHISIKIGTFVPIYTLHNRDLIYTPSN